MENFKRDTLYHQISLPIILFYTVCTKPQPFFTFWIATEITLSSQTYQTAPKFLLVFASMPDFLQQHTNRCKKSCH